MINGIWHQPFNDPIAAARLNARYHDLTGQDHPRFIEQAPKVIDNLIKDKATLLNNGVYNEAYFDRISKIKGNITGENRGIEIIEGYHPLESINEVYNNLSSANLEQVTQLLNYYNGQVLMINGIEYYPFNDPSVAARLNARYHDLTGQDHPRFIEQAPKVIDTLMKNRDKILSTGAYTSMYFDRLSRIKENITGENRGIEIVEGHHPLLDMKDIFSHLDKASLDEVTQLLNYYNGQSVMINGIERMPFNDPSDAARLNARYHDLTGQDHPRFIEQAPKVIDEILKDKDKLLAAGAYTPLYFDRLSRIKGNITGENRGIEIIEGHHQLLDRENILSRLDKASLDEVTQLLNYYNGKSVMINGIERVPSNDPSDAARLNARYHDLTGQDHPRFIEQAPKVIDEILKDKDKLLAAGAYTPDYFDSLGQIKKGLGNDSAFDSKKEFIFQRSQQRKLDFEVRTAQINAMNNNLLNSDVKLNQELINISNVNGGISK